MRVTSDATVEALGAELPGTLPLVIEVRTATRADRDGVARVLGAAFRDDPVVRWLLPHGRRVDALFRTLATHPPGRRSSARCAPGSGTPTPSSRRSIATGRPMWRD